MGGLVPVFQSKLWATLGALDARRYYEKRGFHSLVNLGAARLNSIKQVFLIVLKALNKLVALNVAHGSPRRGSKSTLLRESPGTNILQHKLQGNFISSNLFFSPRREVEAQRGTVVCLGLQSS